MDLRHHSCIRLVNAVFYGRHGVHAEEQRLGGKYEVDADLVFDFREAAEKDDISGTINYQLVYETVGTIMTGRQVYLIETLAHDIARTLMQQFAIVESVTVRVRKRSLPLGGLCDYAEAEYRLERLSSA